MKKYILMATVAIVLGVSLFAGSSAYALNWTKSYVAEVYPGNEGHIYVVLDDEKPGICSGNGYLNISSTHPNKKELFAVFLTALSQNKTVDVASYVDADGQCWIDRARIMK